MFNAILFDIENIVSTIQLLACKLTDRLIKSSIIVMVGLGTTFPAMVQANNTSSVLIIFPQAKRGDVDAQFQLGTMFLTGQGVPEDHSEAMKWFIKAAQQGDARSKCSLGKMFYAGLGVGQSDTDAIKWFEDAANQGYVEAQFELGSMLESSKEASYWLEMAAEKGHVGAQFKLGSLYYQISRNRDKLCKESVKWIQKAAEQNNHDAQLMLGKMLYNGKCTKEDKQEGMKWIIKAEE